EGVAACADVAADEGGDGGGEAEPWHEADHEEAEHIVVGGERAGSELRDHKCEEKRPGEDVGDHLEAGGCAEFEQQLHLIPAKLEIEDVESLADGGLKSEKDQDRQLDGQAGVLGPRAAGDAPVWTVG